MIPGLIVTDDLVEARVADESQSHGREQRGKDRACDSGGKHEGIDDPPPGGQKRQQAEAKAGEKRACDKPSAVTAGVVDQVAGGSLRQHDT